MKQFIWMLCGIFLFGLLLGTLGACGADQFAPVLMVTGQSSENQEDPVPEVDKAPIENEGPEDETSPEAGEDTSAVKDEAPEGGAPLEDGKESPAVKDEARRLAYGRVLWDAYLQGVCPDGTELDHPGGGDVLLAPIKGNEFALADVDGDGEEELLLSWTTASMAGMTEIVFGYRDGAVYEELSEFPDLTFYANGAAEAGWSHNQGLAGRIWPFNAYRYEPESGIYEPVGGMDAWDIAVREANYDEEPFPHDIDADGDGLVYYILPPKWDGQYDIGPVDGLEYESWRNAYLEGAEPVGIPWKTLTEETIAALGAPKPDVTYPEPAG